MPYPQLIQGGMGVAVSSWPLARAVSLRGQLGVVSGTGLDTVLARRLQLGDAGGHLREALSHFPNARIAREIIDKYFVQGGKPKDKPFKSKALPSIKPSRAATELIVAANFVEIFLAKRGHDGVVGVNLLEKIQLPTLPSLFGAMLAGVDFVLMGAGIPRAIPEALDKFSEMQEYALPINVIGAEAGQTFYNRFNPAEFELDSLPSLKRPDFLAIISSAVLANTLARKASGSVEGFVVEAPTAGGHNAPPRGELTLDAKGEPIYGPRDDPRIDQIRELGRPFWLAGSVGSPEGLQSALDQGATGVQIGTAFAFCEESGIDPEIKALVIKRSLEHKAGVFTDPMASPTGFPFKVVELEGTLADEELYVHRERVCDLGYLRECYLTEKGTVGYRCPGEPEDDFERKHGDLELTKGRKCICNGLMATVGLGQVRKGGEVEPPIVTAGDDVKNVWKFLKPDAATYTASDVIDHVLSAQLSMKSN